MNESFFTPWLRDDASMVGKSNRRTNLICTEKETVQKKKKIYVFSYTV